MRTTFVLVVLIGAAAPAGAQGRLADQLRNGIVQEEANQNVEKAIQAYRGIVAQFDEDRKAAAAALFRLAECYRKTGRRDEAVAAYQRVLREFPDQATLAEPSRRQLSETFGVADVRTAADSSEIAQLRRQVTEARRALEQAREREITPEPRPARTREPSAPVTPETAALEIQLIENRLDETQKRFEIGAVGADAVRELQMQLAIAKNRYEQAVRERQEAERQVRDSRLLTAQQLKSVQAEMALVEQQIRVIEKRIAAGTSAADDPGLLQLRRDLIGLQRKAEELQIGMRR